MGAFVLMWDLVIAVGASSWHVSGLDPLPPAVFGPPEDLEPLKFRKHRQDIGLQLPLRAHSTSGGGHHMEGYTSLLTLVSEKESMRQEARQAIRIIDNHGLNQVLRDQVAELGELRTVEDWA
jgi:hypothetical protein